MAGKVNEATGFAKAISNRSPDKTYGFWLFSRQSFWIDLHGGDTFDNALSFGKEYSSIDEAIVVGTCPSGWGGTTGEMM